MTTAQKNQKYLTILPNSWNTKFLTEYIQIENYYCFQYQKLFRLKLTY